MWLNCIYIVNSIINYLYQHCKQLLLIKVYLCFKLQTIYYIYLKRTMLKKIIVQSVRWCKYISQFCAVCFTPLVEWRGVASGVVDVVTRGRVVRMGSREVIFIAWCGESDEYRKHGMVLVVCRGGWFTCIGKIV